MTNNDQLLEAASEKGDELVDAFEEQIPQLSAAPSGFCGCGIAIDRNDDGDLRMTIKVGTDNEADWESFDADTLIDEILDSDLESEIDRAYADLEISSSDFEYVIQPYTID